MRISRKSWHYKMADMLCEYGPSNSLCIYFWQVLGSLFLWVSLAVFALCILWFLVSPIRMFFDEGAAQDAVTLCFIGLGAMFIYLLGRLLSKAKEATFLQVTGEFIAAKKRRICPVIEFGEKS